MKKPSNATQWFVPQWLYNQDPYVRREEIYLSFLIALKALNEIEASGTVIDISTKNIERTDGAIIALNALKQIENVLENFNELSAGL